MVINYSKEESGQLHINLTYRFNKNKIKAARAVKTGLEAEGMMALNSFLVANHGNSKATSTQHLYFAREALDDKELRRLVILHTVSKRNIQCIKIEQFLKYLKL